MFILVLSQVPHFMDFRPENSGAGSVIGHEVDFINHETDFIAHELDFINQTQNPPLNNVKTRT